MDYQGTEMSSQVKSKVNPNTSPLHPPEIRQESIPHTYRYGDVGHRHVGLLQVFNRHTHGFTKGEKTEKGEGGEWSD